MTKMETLNLNLMLTERKLDETETQIQRLALLMNNTNISQAHLVRMINLSQSALALKKSHEKILLMMDKERETETF